MSTSGAGPDGPDRAAWLRKMIEIRLFEDKVQELFMQGQIQGTTHLCQGQEAVCVGAVGALDDRDYLTITYRGHGHALARGMTMETAFGELMGLTSGCCRGVGGSMHFTDFSRGLIGAFAIIGPSYSVALGAAMSARLRGTDSVAMAFCGDGATNIGTFHEALNLAQLWAVPAVFVLEDNKWAESTPESQHSPIRDLSARAKAFGMKAIKGDGQDVEAVYKVTRQALDHARSGKGPVFLHLDTVRFSGHYIGDPQVYRDRDEAKELRATRDPIELLRAKLEVSDDDFAELDTEVTEIVEASVEFAKNGTDPAPEDALKNVYA